MADTIFGMTEEEIKERIHQFLFPKREYRPYKKDYTAADNINTELCKKCGGDCCKYCGCHFSPDDFEEITFECLSHEIDKGYISIEYIDGDVFYSSIGTYILRARNVDEPISISNPFRGKNQCILLTDSGCKLDYEHRPSGGRLLKPRMSKNGSSHACESSYRIYECCKEWLCFKELLAQLFETYEEKDIPCSI